MLKPLPVRVPLSRGEISAQFLCRATRSVTGGIALDAPPLVQRDCVYRIEAKLVEQMSDRGLGLYIVTGDDQRATILRSSGLPVGVSAAA